MQTLRNEWELNLCIASLSDEIVDCIYADMMAMDTEEEQERQRIDIIA